MNVLQRSTLAVLFSATACVTQAAPFQHSWVAPKYAPCEGVGATGSFRVHVSGNVDVAPGGVKTINRLMAHVSSGSFTQSEGTATARAFVTVGAAENKSVILARPTGSVVEPAPKPDESRRLYLPDGAVLAVPKNGELWVAATALLKTSAGSCVLGSSEQKVNLP